MWAYSLQRIQHEKVGAFQYFKLFGRGMRNCQVCCTLFGCYHLTQVPSKEYYSEIGPSQVIKIHLL